MAKFFYNKVYNSKRTIINIVIIGLCAIGIVICFIVTSNFQGENQNKPEGELSIKNETTVEVNEDFKKEVFFSKIENVDLDTIDIVYPDDFSISKIGTYEIGIVVDGQNYTTKLSIVDTTKPELTLKEVTIKPNGTYKASDFVKSCTDNSKKECNIAFYTAGVDENANAVDYSKYKDAGTYPIKIEATDEEENKTVAETKLIITNEEVTPPTEEEPTTPITPPTNCKYGNNIYDKNTYTLAVDVTTNGCAVSLDLYKDANVSAEINKLMESESIRIKRDVEALNPTGTLFLSRKSIAITNTTGDGIVGYELRMTVNVSNNDETKLIVDYKVDSTGKRIFISNPYNISAN